MDLLKGVPSSWKLTIETEKTLAALPVSEAVAVPHALDVKRETGLVALQGTEELGLSVESVSGLERVDAEEFTQAGADKTGRLFSVFRFALPEFALRVRAETVQPEIEAVVRNNFRVGAEQVALSATIDYTIKRTGLVLRCGWPCPTGTALNVSWATISCNTPSVPERRPPPGSNRITRGTRRVRDRRSGPTHP